MLNVIWREYESLRPFQHGPYNKWQINIIKCLIKTIIINIYSRYYKKLPPYIHTITDNVRGAGASAEELFPGRGAVCRTAQHTGGVDDHGIVYIAEQLAVLQIADD